MTPQQELQRFSELLDRFDEQADSVDGAYADNDYVHRVTVRLFRWMMRRARQELPYLVMSAAAGESGQWAVGGERRS
jgi:hypothetical protein